MSIGQPPLTTARHSAYPAEAPQVELSGVTIPAPPAPVPPPARPRLSLADLLGYAAMLSLLALAVVIGLGIILQNRDAVVDGFYGLSVPIVTLVLLGVATRLAPRLRRT